MQAILHDPATNSTTDNSAVVNLVLYPAAETAIKGMLKAGVTPGEIIAEVSLLVGGTKPEVSPVDKAKTIVNQFKQSASGVELAKELIEVVPWVRPLLKHALSDDATDAEVESYLAELIDKGA